MPPTLFRNCLLLIAAFFLMLEGWTSLGQTAGSPGNGRRIGGCPRSPNCVSSMSPAEDRWIAPLDFAISSDEAFRSLQQIIRQMRGELEELLQILKR